MNVFDHGQRPTSGFSPVATGAGYGFLEWALRAPGALSLLAVGAVHLQQYFALYSAIPTSGGGGRVGSCAI